MSDEPRTLANGNYYRDLTYLALRLGIVILTFLLLFAVLLQISQSENLCVKGSLSVYYYTPVGPIFIGALCAIGASLIMYRGFTDPENVALDFSGFLAFVVAFVPTLPENSCGSAPGVLPESAYTLRLISLFAAGALAIIAGWLLEKREAPLEGPPIERMSRATRLSLWFSTAALLGLIAYFSWVPDHAKEHGHGISASLFFIGIFVVVVFNARRLGRENASTGFWNFSKNRYGVIAWLMVFAAIVGLVLYVMKKTQAGFESLPAIFVLEVSQIVLFGVFWGLQTHELGARSPVTRTSPGASWPADDSGSRRQG